MKIFAKKVPKPFLASGHMTSNLMYTLKTSFLIKGRSKKHYNFGPAFRMASETPEANFSKFTTNRFASAFAASS